MKRILLASVVLLAAACKKDTITGVVEAPYVNTVTVVPSANQLEVGRTSTYSVVVKDQHDSVIVGNSPVWSSSNTAVATISATGIVTALTPGTTTIRASVTGTRGVITGTGTLFVINPAVSTVTIVATIPSVFFVGQTVQATASVKDVVNNTLTMYAVTWASSDTTVATVSSTGLITARKAGAATITASAGGKSGTLAITPSLTPVATVSLATASAALKGRTVQVVPTLKSASGASLTTDQRSLVWASMDTSVATVDANGVLRGVSVGSTTVTCIVENKVGILTVTVSQVGISSVKVSSDSVSIKVGATKQFTAQALDAANTVLNTTELDGRSFVWSSNDNTVAAISASGLVTAVAAGSTTITVTVGGVSKTAIIVVVP